MTAFPAKNSMTSTIPPANQINTATSPTIASYTTATTTSSASAATAAAANTASNNQRYRYQSEIQAMMYTFGDVRHPLSSTTLLIEDIVHSQIIELVTK